MSSQITIALSRGRIHKDTLPLLKSAGIELSEDPGLIPIPPSKHELVLVAEMERRSIIKESINKRGAIIYVPDMDAACDVVNRIAP